MKCLLCGGLMEPQIIDVSERVEEQGKFVRYFVTDVPAEVCRQCGETTYSADVVRRLEAVSKQVRKGALPPKTVSVPVFPVDRVVDATGAGDLFAAGFLHGFACGLPHKASAQLGALAAAEVISHMGARPRKKLAELARENGLRV